MRPEKKKNDRKPKKKACKLEITTLFDVTVDIEELDYQDDASYSFDVSINEPKAFEDDLMHWHCTIVIRKADAKDESKYLAIAVAYGCLGRFENMNNDEIVAACKDFTATVVWNQFTALFAVLISQIRVRFPPLPLRPDEIDVTNDEDLFEGEVVSDQTKETDEVGASTL